MLDQKRVKERFLGDTENHSMEIIKDDGLYRHLKFTNNGSQCYRFDIHTWPGYLCICQDMGTYVFSRVSDMFEFFIMNDNDFNKKHVINPSYWAEKLQSVDRDGARGDGNGYEEFSQETFEENVWNDYKNFAEQYEDEDEEGVTEAYPEDTQTYKQMLEELKEALQEEVIDCSHDGQMRAYDAAMSFRWESDNKELKFDMCDFWDYSCTEYTFHYIWILYAIVWGITEYNKVKEPEAVEEEAETVA